MSNMPDNDKFSPARKALLQAWAYFNKGKIREATESCISCLNIAERTQDWRAAEESLVLLGRLKAVKNANLLVLTQLTDRAQLIATTKPPTVVPRPPAQTMPRPPAHPVPRSARAPGLATELATLADLVERGHLTPQEFARAKAQLLATPASSPQPPTPRT
jgi:hypothetical protein